VGLKSLKSLNLTNGYPNKNNNNNNNNKNNKVKSKPFELFELAGKKKKLHDDLYQFLVCQKCEEVLNEGPIYNCDAGDHAACNDCFQTSNVCKSKPTSRLDPNYQKKSGQLCHWLARIEKMDASPF
jgi:hypothetical protein